MAPRMLIAISASCYILCVLAAASGCACTHSKQHHKIAVYGREILNTTSFLTVAGATKTALTCTTAPFGTVFVANDPLYAAIPSHNASLSANVVGSFRGTHTIVSFDGHDVLFQISVSLRRRPLVGTVSLLGVFSYSNPSLPVPVVGGTGAFLLARGTATVSPVGSKPGLDQIFRLDLDLYCPN